MSSAPQLNTPLLRSRLKLKALTSESVLRAHHPQAVALLESSGIKPGQLRAHAARLLATGTLAGTLLLSPVNPPFSFSALPLQPISTPVSLLGQVQSILPSAVVPLTPLQEQQITQALQATFAITAVPVYQGEHLNRTYGYIGQEQHLRRFPGDTLDQHSGPLEEGLALGLGAWGYFAPTKASLTPQLEQIEKYYVAVQTLYLPDWYTRTPPQRQWWQYRRMVVLNPRNGRLMIVAVGDSGPAWWTGKHFGGSPEVMQYLDMKDGRQKGPVIMFFLDDPAGVLPLGPVEYNVKSGQPILA